MNSLVRGFKKSVQRALLKKIRIRGIVKKLHNQFKQFYQLLRFVCSFTQISSKIYENLLFLFKNCGSFSSSRKRLLVFFIPLFLRHSKSRKSFQYFKRYFQIIFFKFIMVFAKKFIRIFFFVFSRLRVFGELEFYWFLRIKRLSYFFSFNYLVRRRKKILIKIFILLTRSFTSLGFIRLLQMKRRLQVERFSLRKNIKYLNVKKQAVVHLMFDFFKLKGVRGEFFFNCFKNYFSSGLIFFLENLKKKMKQFIWVYVFETKRNIFLGARTANFSYLLSQLTAFVVSKKISSKKRRLQLLRNSLEMVEILKKRLHNRFDLSNFDFGLTIKNFSSSRIQNIIQTLSLSLDNKLKFCMLETKVTHGLLAKVSKKRRRKYRGKFLLGGIA